MRHFHHQEILPMVLIYGRNRKNKENCLRIVQDKNKLKKRDNCRIVQDKNSAEQE